ncbi:unnamed protein product, partial [marine sediment metagenome]
PIVSFISFFLCFYNIIPINRIEIKETPNIDNKKILNISAKFTEPFIHITGSNWTETNSTYDWCTGKGTYSEPYIIRDVVITGYVQSGGTDGACILIESSTIVYFQIINCTASTAPSGSYDNGGIHLAGVQKGTIYNNNFSGNAACGIVVKSCQNNTIIGNNVSNNDLDGIHMYNCVNNRIIGNKIIENVYDGITLDNDNDQNLISDNIINGTDVWNYRSGINLRDGNHYNKLIRNNISGYKDEGYGIKLEENNNHTIIENNTIINSYYGIRGIHAFSEGCYNTTILRNNIYGNSWYG